eukprot:UN30803
MNKIAHCKKDFKTAIEILRQSDIDGGTNAFIYTAAINVCANAMKAVYVEDLFREMLQRNMKPNIVTYGALVKVNSQFGWLSKVLDILQDMQDNNIEPNHIIYNSVVNCCIKAKRYDKGIHYWKLMKDTCDLDEISYGTLMNLLLKINKPKEALKIFRMAEKNLDNVTIILYNQALNICGKSGDVQLAIELWDEIEEKKA